MLILAPDYIVQNYYNILVVTNNTSFGLTPYEVYSTIVEFNEMAKQMHMVNYYNLYMLGILKYPTL